MIDRPAYTTKMKNFDESGLKDELLKAVKDLGFVEPTPIQEKTIPVILESTNDLIALAQTGTGKTAAFGLPILEQLDLSEKSVQAIILSPTRELAMQIAKDIESFSKYLPNLYVVPVYGGVAITGQMKDLKRGAHIVVGTPGRTLDLIKRKSLKINNIKWLVLDEADEMLNMGFRDELDGILETTSDEKQTLLFSATMPHGVRRIANDYLNDPTEISAGKINIGATNVEHQFYVVKATNRYSALKRLADYNPNIYGIIFCRTRAETKDVASKLIDDGYNADALHGDLSQAQRDYVMQRFRAKQLQLLVATDVAARGLDINDLSHIINYNMPDDPEVYIHRSGRTGRAGKKGLSIIISHSREGSRIKSIEKLVGKTFTHEKVPSGEQICEKRLYNLMTEIQNIGVDEEKIAPYMPAVLEKLSNLDRDELLKRFVYVEFERFLDYYKNSKDLNVSQSSGRDRDGGRRRDRRDRGRERDRGDRRERNDRGNRSSRRRESSGDFSRLFINVGSKQSLKAPNLMGLVNEFTDSNSIAFGKIDILSNFSFFEVSKDAEQDVIKAFKGQEYGSIKLSVEVSKPEPKRTRNNDDNRRDYKKRDNNRRNSSRKKSYGDRDNYKRRRK